MPSSALPQELAIRRRRLRRRTRRHNLIIIQTARLNGLDPEAYLRSLITRIADHPAKRIGELLPWNINL